MTASCCAPLCRQDLKELKFRPNTDVHDYQVRLRAAQKFIAKVRMHPRLHLCHAHAHANTLHSRQLTRVAQCML